MHFRPAPAATVKTVDDLMRFMVEQRMDSLREMHGASKAPTGIKAENRLNTAIRHAADNNELTPGPPDDLVQ